MYLIIDEKEETIDNEIKVYEIIKEKALLKDKKLLRNIIPHVYNE